MFQSESRGVARPVDVDALGGCERRAVQAETVRRQADERRVDGASTLVAPHDPVDVVVAAVILDE